MSCKVCTKDAFLWGRSDIRLGCLDGMRCRQLYVLLRKPHLLGHNAGDKSDEFGKLGMRFIFGFPTNVVEVELVPGPVYCDSDIFSFHIFFWLATLTPQDCFSLVQT